MNLTWRGSYGLPRPAGDGSCATSVMVALRLGAATCAAVTPHPNLGLKVVLYRADRRTGSDVRPQHAGTSLERAAFRGGPSFSAFVSSPAGAAARRAESSRARSPRDGAPPRGSRRVRRGTRGRPPPSRRCRRGGRAQAGVPGPLPPTPAAQGEGP